MGCCESTPNDVVPDTFSTVTVSSSPTSADLSLLAKILNGMPSDCRPAIMALPVQSFLRLYKLHLNAIEYVRRRQFFLGYQYERQAMFGILALLPNDEGHFIFADMCYVLSRCYLALNGIEKALYCARLALGICQNHTPTDYRSLKAKYWQLALVRKAGQEWREAAACLQEALAIARLYNEPDKTYIQTLEAELALTRQCATDNTLANATITLRQVQPHPDESSADFHRRTMAEAIAFNAANGTVGFDKAEFERLPDKQTEIEVDEPILVNVLKALENYLKSNGLNYWLTSGVSVNFIAAQFKHQHMKESPHSPAVIEAALTMIIDRMKSEDASNDERYAELKQLPSTISYTDNNDFYTIGVRVFRIRSKETL